MVFIFFVSSYIISIKSWAKLVLYKFIIRILIFSIVYTHIMLLQSMVYFYIAISIFFNTFLKNAGLVIACTIGTIFILSGINTVVGHRLTWFPNQLTAHINDML